MDALVLQPRRLSVVWIETCPNKKLNLIRFTARKMAERSARTPPLPRKKICRAGRLTPSDLQTVLANDSALFSFSSAAELGILSSDGTCCICRGVAIVMNASRITAGNERHNACGYRFRHPASSPRPQRAPRSTRRLCRVNEPTEISDTLIFL
jgi:hypothetical protein